MFILLMQVRSRTGGKRAIPVLPRDFGDDGRLCPDERHEQTDVFGHAKLLSEDVVFVDVSDYRMMLICCEGKAEVKRSFVDYCADDCVEGCM